MKNYIIAILVLVIASWFYLISNKVDKSYNEVMSGFNFNLNTKSHYQITNSIIFDNTDVLYAVSGDITTKIDLDMRVFKKEKEFIYIGFQFSDIDISIGNKDVKDSLEKLYSIFFIVKIDYSGKFIEYYFPKDIQNIKGLSGLVSQMQVVFSKKPVYSVEEDDFLEGVYKTMYRNVNNILNKKREKYIAYNDDTMQTKIIKSNMIIKIDKTGNWIESLKGLENIIIKDNGVDAIKNKNIISIEKLYTPVNSSLQIWNEDRDIKDIIESFKQNSKDDTFTWQKEQDKILKNYIKKNNITFKSLLSKIDNNSNSDFSDDLEKYLRLNPNEIYKLYHIIDGHNNIKSAKLIRILGSLNTLEAQTVLLKIAEGYDDVSFENNNMNAILELGKQKNLDNNIVNTLWSFQDIRSDEYYKDRSNTILLALGNLSSHNNMDISDKIDQRLKDLLYDDSYDKSTLLYAMENSGTKKFESTIVEVLEKSSDNFIKATAIDVLGSIQTDEIEDILYLTMKSSSSNLVKEQAIKKLLNFKTDERIVKDIQSTIKTLPDSRVRDKMIYYLVKTVKEYPENKQYLENILTDTQDIRTKKMIIRTIRR